MILGKVQPHFCLSFPNLKWKSSQPASENCFNIHGKKTQPTKKKTHQKEAKVLQTHQYEEPTTIFSFATAEVYSKDFIYDYSHS